MRSSRKLFRKMAGGGDLYMTGIDKNSISKFTPGQIQGLALWIKADQTKCTMQTVEDYVKTISPSIGANILSQFPDPSQPVIVAIQSLLTTSPNALVRLEIDTTGTAKFPTFISDPEKLDVISIQAMLDPAGRKEKLCTKTDISLPSMAAYTIGTNIAVTYNNTLNTLLVSAVDLAQPATEFSEIIVFSRVLSQDEVNMVEGYLAFKRNDQYLLRPGHPYIPNIESIPFVAAIQSQLSSSQISLETDMENFDAAVKTYAAKLPTAEILQKAPPLKQKVEEALKQIATIRETVAKGALLARKQKTETVSAVFDAINKLALYQIPFTADSLNGKIADFASVAAEMEAYMKSLENVESDVAAAVVQNNMSDQIKKRADAISAEALIEKQAASDMAKVYIDLRQAMAPINAIGSAKYDAMYTDFTKKVTVDGDNMNYYNTNIKSNWDTLFANYETLDDIITSGEWLTYDPAIKTDNTTLKRGDRVFSIQYKNEYLQSIQTLYEKIRNQIVEGDFAYLHAEADYIMSMYNAFVKRVLAKTISPLSKKLFSCLFKKKLKMLIDYNTEFMKLYTVIGDAITELLRILGLNKRYKSSQVQLEKSYPIPVAYHYKESSQKLRFIRELNKHDNSLTMIEYIVTEADGTIDYIDADSMEVDLVFPSMENIFRAKGDDFYTKKIPFCDENGAPLFQKIMILKPYAKTEGILDSISKSQILPKFFHVVDGQFEVPRDADNSIYEMSAMAPQPPILLPKYAVADGTFFICVNVGAVPLSIRIPGFTKDTYDLVGPDEVCMYIYTGVAASTTTFYGRKQWISNRIAYDTILNVPRSSLCRKLTDIEKTVFMSTDTRPLFDRNGFLVEAVPDENSNIYDIDDFYKANPYKVTLGPDMKISDLDVKSEWGEQPIPASVPSSIYVGLEAATGLMVFCNLDRMPAMNEFGYAKYLRAPILQINNRLVTRSSTDKFLELNLISMAQLVQYGLMPKDDIFAKLYRSNFVKPFSASGAGPVSNFGPTSVFVFTNSIGYPLVSPNNKYIHVDNSTFTPPYYVKYTENFVSEYSFIPEEGKFFKANTTILDIETYMKIYLKTPEEKEAAETTKAIQLTSYRYSTGKAYIQYALTRLQADLTTCNSLKANFAGITDTIALLQKCISDITGWQADYQSYNTTITALKTRDLISNTSTDQMLAMDTFDLKMKDTLNRVYASFTTGIKPVIFFKCILKKIDKIRKQVKDLQDAKSIAIVKSLTNIQTVITGEATTQGGTKNSRLTELLNTCTTKKVEFDGIVKTLNEALNAIPSDLDDLEKWVTDQTTLIEHATDIYEDIMDIDNLQTVEVFTQQIMNNISNTTALLQANIDKVNALIEYKKKIAKWLEVYPDKGVQHGYSNDIPVPTNATSLKGYTISFLPFEEIQNPLVSRDWYALLDTDILLKSTRTRISINLIDPIKAFIKKYESYYGNYAMNANAPDPTTYQRAMDDELKKIVDASNKTVGGLIAEAVEAEAELAPIFKEYENIRSDLRVEIQKVLVATATGAQTKWLDCTGKRTAIQTNATLLQQYLTEAQTTQVAEVTAQLDQLFTSDKLSGIDDIQRSLKISDYYASMSYIKMIQVNTNWNNVDAVLVYIQDQIPALQDTMNKIQAETVSTMQADIQTGISAIQKAYDAKKAVTTDGTQLKTLMNTMDPQIADVTGTTATDLPSSIQLKRNITAIENQLKTISI